MSYEDAVFKYSEEFSVTPEIKQLYDHYGFIILKGLLDTEELTKLKTALEHDEGIKKFTYGSDDGEGRKAELVVWSHPGNDITGMVARSEKVAGTCEKLLGGEVYHYHSKLIKKEARVGGAHAWHQDYGYWYHNGCIFPNMGTMWLAVDKATKESGCLQVLVGSHRVGRIHHLRVGTQVGADLDRVAHVQKFCELTHVELDPGDALFFHCNLLHRSDQNRSDHRRWALLCCYNRADNDPVIKHHHPQYTPLNKVANSAIRQCTTDTDITGKDFFKGLKDDGSLKAVTKQQSQDH